MGVAAKMSRNRLSSDRFDRHRPASGAAAAQFSLFTSAEPEPKGDARYFRRQAQLCQRLLGAMHQPDLVALLGRLYEEFEARASEIEALSLETIEERSIPQQG